jgi:hypothetical protein
MTRESMVARGLCSVERTLAVKVACTVEVIRTIEVTCAIEVACLIEAWWEDSRSHGFTRD